MSATVIFEAVYILSGRYAIERARLRQALQSIVEFDSIVLADKAAIVNALEIYPLQRALSFADCYHAALSLDHCDGEIYTYDASSAACRVLPGWSRGSSLYPASAASTSARVGSWSIIGGRWILSAAACAANRPLAFGSFPAV